MLVGGRKCVLKKKNPCLIGVLNLPELEKSVCQLLRFGGDTETIVVLHSSAYLRIHSRHTKCSLAGSFHCCVRHK